MSAQEGTHQAGLGKWADVPTSIVSDVTQRFGAMSACVKQISGTGLVGTAHTVRVMAGDNRSIHLALESVSPGSALVIDAGGYVDRAVWGEVLTIAAIQAGVVGVVIDGALRDSASISALGFPVYARATNPAGPHKAGGGVTRIPISCGGVPVSQGDLVLGDADGVVVVAAAEIDDVYEQARLRIATEREWIARLNAGESSASILGLD